MNRREDDRSGSILAHSATPPLQQRAHRGCQVCPAQFGNPVVAPVAGRSEHGVGAIDVCTRVDTGSFRSPIAMTPTAGSLRPVESRDVPRRIGPSTACWSRSAKRRSCDSSAATPPSTPTASSGCGEFAIRRGRTKPCHTCGRVWQALGRQHDARGGGWRGAGRILTDRGAARRPAGRGSAPVYDRGRARVRRMMQRCVHAVRPR